MTIFEEIEELRITVADCEKEEKPVFSSHEQYQDAIRERQAIEDQERFYCENVWHHDYDAFYKR